MQRFPANLWRKMARPPCDIFISYRRIDTNRTVVRLLYDHLTERKVRPFLDSMSMKPGDRIFDHINNAILGCKVGVAVFSPHYCESNFCLHELALLIESKKRVVPILYNIKPSQLRIKDIGKFPTEKLQRFSSALEEAKCVVGVTFDSLNGDWTEQLRNASDAIIMNLLEEEGDGIARGN